ncbi:ATP-binding cassette domain-containing protein [Paracoccus sp. 1_MG-2023]|uniref:ABC transporter ATP-binding protein/permease n=1 Tax=unclassified Paracoccus (in: a-proteobacteria) TaxID=2688777 RepID=UPI001C096875|nr:MULTISPECIES: ATP-binding cassette domain-containing protein [unclassified Paracoccus (in: a-proteobacteria)]MBU2957999.1 ATP-binding cassette domain-containing protein [Paracoccus sp. C2R09]MDO6668807.1 ATP-binding cassette domain-containing protein [Paracoccus sp. 1_MG-2023]
MPDAKQPAAPNPRALARDRIIRPVEGLLKSAGRLSVLSGMLWPVQAGAIAWAVSGWVDGATDPARTLVAAAIFALCGLIRAALDHRAGALLFDAADTTIARERAALIGREARALADAGSASLASLAVQKLPLLQPWITRYHVAMMRVMVLPPLLLVLAFTQSWVVGLTLLVAGPLIPLFMALVGMAAEETSRRQMDEIASMNDMLMDRLAALTDIRLLGATDRAARGFALRAETLRTRTMAVLRIAFLSSTVLELFSALGVALVAVFVGFTLLGEIGFGSWGSPLTLGEGLFLLLIAPEFFQPLRDLSAAWHDRAAGLAVVSELDALDGAERVAMMGEGAAVGPLAGRFDLRCEDACAMLPGRRVAIPDLQVGPGGTLAITGPSGAGKSTTLAAIAGLVPLASGRIGVCGATLGPDTADRWRSRIAFVPQRPHFPDLPLRDWLDPRGMGADPWAALRLADATRIVERLPDGLETHLGESGGGVSGGEARRLMLARAVMAGGDLILADEPTADLDDETAARIIAALARIATSGRAIVVATHDPALAAAMAHKVEVRA